MPFKISRTRWLAALMAGVVALGTLAPAAEAGRSHGNGHKSKRYKDTDCETHVVGNSYYPRVVVHEHSHGSELGAFVGGLILGAVVSSAAASANERPYDRPSREYDHDHSCSRPASSYYYDSYCNVRYSSFDDCEFHYSHCRHPQVVHVIEIRTGRTLDRYSYEDGEWHDGNGRYGADHRYQAGCDDERGRDDDRR